MKKRFLSFISSSLVCTVSVFAVAKGLNSDITNISQTTADSFQWSANHEIVDEKTNNENDDNRELLRSGFRDNAETLCTENFVLNNYLNVYYVTGMSYLNILSACGSLYSFYCYLDGLGYATPTSKNSSYGYLDIYFLNCSSESLGYGEEVVGLTYCDSQINFKTYYSTIYILEFSSPSSDKLNTIYHEFFHAVQNMYYSTSNYQFKEAVARWVGNTYSSSFRYILDSFYDLYLYNYYSLDYYSNHDYLYCYVFDIIYDMFNNDLDTMFSFLLDYYEALNLRTSSTITLTETLAVIDSVINSYNSLYSFEKVWFNMVVRYLGCDVPYYDYFYPTSHTYFNYYFTEATYYGPGYMSASVSFTDWGFRMYEFPALPSSPYYSRVKFQMSGNHSFAIVVYDPVYHYQSVVYSNTSNYFQFTYDINTYRLGNVRFAVVNLEKATLSTSLYIYQLV